jgi:hypothetical protein
MAGTSAASDGVSAGGIGLRTQVRGEATKYRRTRTERASPRNNSDIDSAESKYPLASKHVLALPSGHD